MYFHKLLGLIVKLFDVEVDFELVVQRAEDEDVLHYVGVGEGFLRKRLVEAKVDFFESGDDLLAEPVGLGVCALVGELVDEFDLCSRHGVAPADAIDDSVGLFLWDAHAVIVNRWRSAEKLGHIAHNAHKVLIVFFESRNPAANLFKWVCLAFGHFVSQDSNPVWNDSKNVVGLL